MNKKITFITITFLVVSIFLVGSRRERQELYLKAVAEKDLSTKMQLLKDYIEKFGDKEDKFLRFIYLNLADTAFKLKNYDECIQYGEIAMEKGEIDKANKLRLYFSLANSYYATKRDMDKAYQYAQSVIDLSKTLIEQTQNSSQDQQQADQFAENYKNFYIAPAYRLQGLILYFKDKDNPDNIKQAAEKAIEAFNQHETDIYYKMAFSLAGNLAQKGKFDYAIAVAEKIVDLKKPKYKEADFLAKLYSKRKDKEKTILFCELAYQAKPGVELAMKIGQMVHKKDVNKAIRYFADAYVLLKLDKQSDAFKYLEHLYFNEVAKDKTPEEKEAGFKQIINAAGARLGVEIPQESMAKQNLNAEQRT
ncbi:MAG: tetratricopeptide repeat protein [Candidatus Aminicenantes bacterium]|nr:MAG: tetratricopeptide repeat protein [Candidatus Aminicenantes bacterium]